MLDAIVKVVTNMDPGLRQITGFFVLGGFIYYAVETVLEDLSKNKK